jgi:CBS domain-containing protein
MTRQVIAVPAGVSVLEAVRLMLQNRISGLPVVDDAGRLSGLVTEGDFLRRVETGTERRRPRWLQFLLGPGRLAEDYVQAHARKVDDVMTRDPVTVSSDTPLERVVQLMEKHRVKRLPVVDGGQLVGIVSRADLMHALASLAQEMPPPLGSDIEIRERLLSECSGKPWSPARLNAVVRNGEVELSGVIFDERTREAVIVAAQNVPGVKTVHDHLAWVEPASGMVIYSPADEKTGNAGAH